MRTHVFEAKTSGNISKTKLHCVALTLFGCAALHNTSRIAKKIDL